MATGQQLGGITDPVLRDYHEQLEAVRREARDMAAGLDRLAFNWRPDGRRWSVGQCLEHLVLTARLYPDRIEAMIGEARARQAQGRKPYRRGLIADWVIRGMEPPPGLRIRSPRRVEPASGLDPAEVLAVFEEVHGRLGALMHAADGVSLQHARMRSPFLPLLWFTTGQAFAVNLSHARRHLWQARQVLKEPAFPAG
jgi:hypothetical protein